MRFEAERDLVCNAIARLKDWGLLDMTGGAVSVRAADGTILVTPSGTSFRSWQMVPSDVIALSPQGEIVDRSSRLAASGTQLHLAIYATFPAVGAVVHCHAPYSLAFASLGVPVPSVTNQADTLGEIPCLIADDAAVKEQVRSGRLTVPVPEGIVQRPDVNAVNVIELIPQLRDHFLPRADEITWHGLAFTIYRHGAVAMARGLYEATENLARVEVSARTALFQAILRGGMAGIAVNTLFPQAEPTTRPGAVGQALPPRNLSTVTSTIPGASLADAHTAEFYARLPTTRGAAGALLIDHDGRILLVERVYDAVWPWGLPGGIIETNESPLSACVREVREELEIDPIIDHLAAIDWVPPRPPKTAGNIYLFTGRIPAPASIRLDPTELSAWAWVTPTEIPHLLAAHTARRVDAALAAHTARRTVYLEDGYHPLPSCS